MNGYTLSGTSDSEIRLTANSRRRLCVEWSQKFNVVNALNLGYLAAFIYSPGPAIQKILTDIFDSGRRTFEIDKQPVTSPFICPASDEFPLSDNQFFSFVDTTSASGIARYASTNTQLAMFDDDTQVYIAVRGTEGFSWPNGIRDWIQNAQATQVRFKEGMGDVHKGFYDCFLSVKDAIDRYLSAGNRTAKKIVVTGHSLGGAVATIIAAYIRHNLSQQVMLYTFGSPRAGDKNFVDHYTRVKTVHAWRIFHVSDVVPLVPLERMDISFPGVAVALATGSSGLFIASVVDTGISPFTHFGKPVALQREAQHNGILQYNPSPLPPFELYTGTAQQRQNWQWKELFGLPTTAIVDAHAMNMYLHLLGTVLRRWARSYRDNELQSHDPATLREVELRLAAFKKREQELMIEQMKEEMQKFAVADATATRTPRTTVAEQKVAIGQMIAACQSYKAACSARLSALRSPESVARFIAGEQYNAHIHRELCFHAGVKSGQ